MLIASVPIGMQFLLLLHLPTRCISGVFPFSRVISNSFTSVSTVGHLLCYSHPSLCRMRAESGPDMYSLLTVNILCLKKRLLGIHRVLSHPCSRFPLISIPGSRKFLQIQILSDSLRFSQVFSDSLRFSQILLDSLRFSQVLPGSIRFS